jgi:cytoskeleton protein RodZ
MNESLHRPYVDYEEAEGPASMSNGAEDRSPGQILREARLRHDYTLDDLCLQTKLAPKILRALEDDDFDALPPPVFARGYYRQCAKVLDLDPERLLTAYAAWAGAPLPQPSTGSAAGMIPQDVPPGLRRRFKLALLLAVVLVVIVAVVILAPRLRTSGGGGNGGHFTGSSRGNTPSTGDIAADRHPAAPDKPRSKATRSPAGGGHNTNIASGGAPPIAGTGEMTGQSDHRPATSASSPKAAAAGPTGASVGHSGQKQAAPPPVPANRLKLTFSKRSWVSVVDANGNRLLYGTYQPGTSREFNGAPPYRIVLGVASGVDVTIGGRKVDLGAHIAANGTARLRVGAHGGG